MNFKQFKTKAQNELQKYLPSKFYDGKLQFMDNDDEEIALFGKDKEHGMMKIDFHQYYESYLNGSSFEDVMHELVRYCENFPMECINTEIFQYENAKDRIFLRLQNPKNIRCSLDDIPHKKILDLVITYHILFSDEHDELISGTLTNHILDTFPLTLDELHKLASMNSEKLFPVSFHSMSTYIDFDLIDLPVEQNQLLYVLTNENQCNGASVLCYENTCKEIAKILHDSFYILPSSIHEVLIKTANVVQSAEAIRYFIDTIHEVNTTMVEEKEQLSDHLYYYDADKNELNIVDGDMLYDS